MNILRYKSTHEQRLERWFGVELVDKILLANHYWPIGIATPDAGECRLHAYKDSIYGVIRGGGFASLSDLISEATTGGKRQEISFTKAGTTGVAGVMNSLARVGAVPPGQTTAAAFAAGESPTNTTPTGLGLANVNAAGGDTLHAVTFTAVASVASQLLLLYDRFYQGNWNIATDPQTVSGTPTRYQNATDSPGCFISAEVSTALGAGTPTITITYTDQAAASSTATVLTVAASAIVNRFPHATPDWRYPLAAGDTGVRTLTNLDLSAVSTGNLNVFLGKPLVYVPLPPIANVGVTLSLINDAFNLPQIFDNACLCLLELFKSATTATNYTGSVTLVSG